jgi:hypothetical protein
MKRSVLLILACVFTLGVGAPALASGARITCYPAQMQFSQPFSGNWTDALRLQTVVEQSVIRYAGNLNEIWFNSYDGVSGRYDNFVVWACHTTRTNLQANFDGNYSGTARRLRDPASYSPPARKGWFRIGLDRTFAYNNRNHLLLEFRWLGDNGGRTLVWNTSSLTGNRTIYARSRTAENAEYFYSRAFHLMLDFDYYTAAEPTSLGRIRAVFR